MSFYFQYLPSCADGFGPVPDHLLPDAPAQIDLAPSRVAPARHGGVDRGASRVRATDHVLLAGLSDGRVRRALGHRYGTVSNHHKSSWIRAALVSLSRN